MEKKARVNMNIPHELKSWAQEQADKNGFSLTMMIQLMMLDYKKQMEALDMSKIAQMFVEFQEQKQESQ